MKYELGFMGCGNMGGALCRAAAKSIDAKTVAVSDPDAKKCAALKNDLGVTPVSLRDLAEESRFFVLGVKPQILFEATKEVSEILKNRKDVTVISMAAGISIAAVKSATGADSVIRIMPNTPAAVGEGLILYAVDNVSEETERAFLAAFSAAGRILRIAEDKIDAASALSGCGPAFCYLFLEALADGAVECGIPRDTAVDLAAQTLLGSAKMVQTYGNPAALKDAVCSPGGTTIAGVHALEKDGFRAAAMDAVKAAYDKTLSLKK